MGQTRVKITLQPAPDDLPVNDPEFQEELREFSQSLRAAGVTFMQQWGTLDDQRYLLGDFKVKTLVPEAIGMAAAVCVDWVNARSGRKLLVQVADIEAEAQASKQIENLVKWVAACLNDEDCKE